MQRTESFRRRDEKHAQGFAKARQTTKVTSYTTRCVSSMKSKFLSFLALSLALLLSGHTGASAAANPPDAAFADAFNAIVAKVQAKANEGKKAEADYADEFAAIDTLLAKYKDKKSPDAAVALELKLDMYLQLFENSDKAIAVVNQLKTEFPASASGQRADELIEMIKQNEEARKIRATLVPGSAFPAFEEKDVSGAPLSLAQYKGKIVLVDFWATWCGPCMAEMPNVIAAYQKYHDRGFEIVGISLDQNRAGLQQVTKEQGMPWAQYFDGKGWESKLATRYGIKAIPAAFLLDEEGKIIATDLRGEELASELEKRLGAKTK
jgi:thiol-disulfide isomerase/thioredoxin